MTEEGAGDSGKRDQVGKQKVSIWTDGGQIAVDGALDKPHECSGARGERESKSAFDVS